jgi:hypothetical protein
MEIREMLELPENVVRRETSVVRDPQDPPDPLVFKDPQDLL